MTSMFCMNGQDHEAHYWPEDVAEKYYCLGYPHPPEVDMSDEPPVETTGFSAYSMTQPHGQHEWKVGGGDLNFCLGVVGDIVHEQCSATWSHYEHLWPLGAEVQKYCVGIAGSGPQPEHDAVNHPKHYTSHPSGVECITVTRHMNFNLGNVVKYVWRAGMKDEAPTIQDLEKAAWYLNDEIEQRKKEEQ